MDLIHKATMSRRPIRGDKSQYFNNADYWLYNVNDVPKFRNVQIDISEAQDGSEMVDSAAMTMGITNILQPGELPTLSGAELDGKYWKVGAEDKPVRMTKTERDAVDAAEAQAAADRQAKIDAYNATRPKRSEIAAMESQVAAAQTVPELRAAVIELNRILKNVLTYQRVDILED